MLSKNAIALWISYTELVNSKPNGHLTSSVSQESNTHTSEVTAFDCVVGNLLVEDQEVSHVMKKCCDCVVHEKSLI